MPKYLIERQLPGAGRLTPQQLREISQKSCGVLSEMGPDIQWQHSYVSDDAIHCVYIAPNEAWCASTRARADSRPTGFPR